MITKMKLFSFIKSSTKKFLLINFIKMQTRLRSRQHFPRLNRPISCNVKFEGSSVIEGIKNLGSQSFVDIPLPSYMANLHSLSKNSFLLKEKKNAEEGCTGDSSQQHNDKC